MSAPVQPFPVNGLLAKNLNLSYPQLSKRLRKRRCGAYSYVVKSVALNRNSCSFEHHGSAPNFQGGLLTLCTCKHQMRAGMDCSEWVGRWIVGLTSRCRYQGRHWLFYLTRVAAAHESHADLWASLPATIREAKSTQDHFLGDVFAPWGKVTGEGRFAPGRYLTPPRHSHRRHKCDNGWHNDINYRHSGRYGHPPLLVGDPELTFLWDEPIIFLDEPHCRNFRKWDSLAELLPHLGSEAS